MAVPFSPRSLEAIKKLFVPAPPPPPPDEGEVGEEAAQRRLKEIEDYNRLTAPPTPQTYNQNGANNDLITPASLTGDPMEGASAQRNAIAAAILHNSIYRTPYNAPLNPIYGGGYGGLAGDAGGYGAPSGAPSSGAPSSGAPSSGAPSSGAPSSGAPSSGAPSSGAPSGQHGGIGSDAAAAPGPANADAAAAAAAAAAVAAAQANATANTGVVGQTGYALAHASAETADENANLGPNSTTTMGDPTGFPNAPPGITGINESQTSSQGKNAPLSEAQHNALAIAVQDALNSLNPTSQMQNTPFGVPNAVKTVPITPMPPVMNMDEPEPAPPQKGWTVDISQEAIDKAIAEMEQTLAQVDKALQQPTPPPAPLAPPDTLTQADKDIAVPSPPTKGEPTAEEDASALAAANAQAVALGSISPQGVPAPNTALSTLNPTQAEMAEANLAANMADAAAITANSPTGLSVSVAPGVVGMHGFTGFSPSPPGVVGVQGPPGQVQGPVTNLGVDPDNPAVEGPVAPTNPDNPPALTTPTPSVEETAVQAPAPVAAPTQAQEDIGVDTMGNVTGHPTAPATAPQSSLSPAQAALAAAIAAHGPVGPLGHPSAVTAPDQTAADPTGLQSDPGLAAQQSAVAAQQSAVAPSTAVSMGAPIGAPSSAHGITGVQEGPPSPSVVGNLAAIAMATPTAVADPNNPFGDPTAAINAVQAQQAQQTQNAPAPVAPIGPVSPLGYAPNQDVTTPEAITAIQNSINQTMAALMAPPAPVQAPPTELNVPNVDISPVDFGLDPSMANVAAMQGLDADTAAAVAEGLGEAAAAAAAEGGVTGSSVGVSVGGTGAEGGPGSPGGPGEGDAGAVGGPGDAGPGAPGGPGSGTTGGPGDSGDSGSQGGVSTGAAAGLGGSLGGAPGGDAGGDSGGLGGEGGEGGGGEGGW
jgi:hypothetical protein